MTDTKYTFLLPAYKAKYLEESLRSIQQQTYTDFKVIVSDDCSPEDIKGVFDKVCGNDKRFEYRRNDTNMGSKSLVSHWNLLVDMCDTEFLIMASDDDVYSTIFLEEIGKLVYKYPLCDVYRGRVKKVNGNNCIVAKEAKSSELLNVVGFIHRSYLKDFIACISNYCYRSNTLKKNCGFIDFPSAWFSDDATNIMMAKSGIATTENFVFNFRGSDINISGMWGNPTDCMKKISATLCFYEWMNHFMDDYKETDLFYVINKEWKYKVFTNIQNYIYHCPSCFFLSNILKIPNDIGISKLRILAHWLNIRLHLLS